MIFKQGSALTCLKHGDLRQLSDILSELGGNLNLNHGYPEESFKTLLQVPRKRNKTDEALNLLQDPRTPGITKPYSKYS